MDNDLSQFWGVGAIVRQSILETGVLGTSDSWVDRYIQRRGHSKWDKIALQAVVQTRHLQTSTCLWLHRKESMTPPSNSPPAVNMKNMSLIARGWPMLLHSWYTTGGSILSGSCAFKNIMYSVIQLQFLKSHCDFTARRLDFEVSKHIYEEESRKTINIDFIAQ